MSARPNLRPGARPRIEPSQRWVARLSTGWGPLPHVVEIVKWAGRTDDPAWRVRIVSGPTERVGTFVIPEASLVWRKARWRECPSCEGEGEITNSIQDTVVCGRCRGHGLTKD